VHHQTPETAIGVRDYQQLSTCKYEFVSHSVNTHGTILPFSFQLHLGTQAHDHIQLGFKYSAVQSIINDIAILCFSLETTNKSYIESKCF
jgi:hypothetical protein